MEEIIHNGEIDPVALWELFNTADFNRLGERKIENAVKMLENTDHYICCYNDGALVGFVRLLTDYFTTGYVFDLCVGPDHRKVGIGGKLMREMIDYCDKRGIVVVHLLNTSQYPNYYAQFGFESSEGIKGMYRLNPSLRKTM